MNEAEITGAAAVLPDQFVPVENLSIASTPRQLRDLGFEGAFVAEDIHTLAHEAGRLALEDASLAATEVDVVLCASALAASHHCPSDLPGETLLHSFCYPSSRLQGSLGLDRAIVTGVSQQGCVGFLAALRIARAMVVGESGLNHVLCVGSDALPAGSTREILYNVISDAACAAVVSRQVPDARPGMKWLAFHQVSRGYYWDVPARNLEILASYFPTAKRTIAETLRRAHLGPEDIDLVIPTGVGGDSWPILMDLCGIPADRLFVSRRKFGHTISADGVLFLEEASAAGALRPGMRVLFFTFGFGSNWCGLVLEVRQ